MEKKGIEKRREIERERDWKKETRREGKRERNNCIQAGNIKEEGSVQVDLLIKVTCFVTKESNIFNIEGANLNLLVQGGQLYWAFPFSEDSLIQVDKNVPYINQI